MKNLIKYTYLAFLLLIIFSLSCKKDEDKVEIENTLGLTTNYTGWLDISFTSTLPPFEAFERIPASLDKDLEVILFESGSLSYSGDTIIEDESKVERDGSWTIQPLAFMEKVGNDVQIDVNVGITVDSDIMKVYAKNTSGNWVLVNEIDMGPATPNSDLTFSLRDAEVSGSVLQVVASTGSISFSLYLTPELVP